MPSVFNIVATIIAAYFSTFIYCFFRNLRDARKTGFPSIICPWDQNHVVWMVVSVPLYPLIKQWLPGFISDRLILSIYGWEFWEKLRPFKQFLPPGNDKSFMLVTCGRPELTTCDPEIVVQILSRPRDFYQLDLTDLFMNKFGRNVLTSHGEAWTRQRKIVASVINERISKAVFDETVRQTQGLVQELNESASNGSAETNKLFDMAKKITINVLSGAGMGASVPWEDNAAEKPDPGFKQTYIQSVKGVMTGVTGFILIPKWILVNWPSFLPGQQLLNSIGYGLEEFPAHTTNLLERERERSKLAGGGETRNNIMSQLIHASEQSEDAESTQALTEDEMMGNLFIFTAAGFDTTANTISYSLALLARYPRWQDWLLEEIDALFPSHADQETSGYVALFPNATRVMAFMLETLRLFTPLIHISKQTRTPQIITTSRGTFYLPANTTTFIDTIGLHLDPDVWENLNPAKDEEVVENDAECFRPARWINPSGSLFQPPKGAFVPWSAGPRVCPGQKMAQVEFVAVFLTLLRNHRIDAVPLPGESRTDTEKRLDMRMQKSIAILTLQMVDVYDMPDGSDKALTLSLSRRK